MRGNQFEVNNTPSYLLHPENRRVEYGGGFRIIKPERIDQDKCQQIPIIQQQKQVQIKVSPQIVFKNQQPIKVPANPITEQYSYNYYHDDKNFSNFFGLEDQQYHICMSHDKNCHVCHTCKPQLGFNKDYCYLCSGKREVKKNATYSKIERRQSQRKYNRTERQVQLVVKEQRIDSEPAQILSLTPKNSGQNQIDISQSKLVYQIIDEPLPPQNASAQQKLDYQNKYKQYLLKKRDLYYLGILRKMIDKIDFERYQCTSPNEERIHAHWFGIYKPRIMQTSAGKVKYQTQNHPGYEFLKSFIFVYVYQNKFKEKESYEVNAQMFLNAFQELLSDTEKANPTKALQKLHADLYKRMLEGKISKSKLKEFLNKLNFILLAFNINDGNQRLNKLPNEMSLSEYKRFFTMIIKPASPKHPDIKQIIQKNNSYKAASKQKFTFKPVFPEIQQIQHIQLKTSQPLATSKKLTIRQKRLLADLMQRQAKQQELINYKFKAKQIPKDVRDRSLYQKKLDQQMERSIKNKEESAKQLLLNQNPFTFYYRDLNKENPIQQFKQYQSFKATEVPHYVIEPRYQKMLEQKESLKKHHLEERQNQLLKSSKFPATMGYLQNYSAFKSKKQEQLPYKFQPSISKQIPNFDHLHNKNIVQLENKKQLNRTITTPQQFNLSKGNKKKTEDIPPPKAQQMKKRVSQSVDNRQYMSGSTLKYDALVQHRRRQNQQKQRKQTLRESQLLSKTSRNQQVLKQKLHKTIKQGEIPTGANFVLPPDQWNELEKQKMLDKVYGQRPMLIDRKYERVNGMKIQVFPN